MMKNPSIPDSHHGGITPAEVLFALLLIAMLAGLFPCTCGRSIIKAPMTAQAVNGRNLFTAMVCYAEDRDYPLYKNKDDPSTKVLDSNEAFEILLKGGYLDDKKVLFQRNSAWCKKAVNSEATAKQVLPGENDWCYVAGLNRATARSAWPILANAFSPGTTHYVADVGKKGGGWKGTRAVVVYCGGNAEVVETLAKGEGFIVRRPDKVTEDAFVPEGEWLSGEKVKVLYPKEW
jgi:hypothetical protein